MFFNNLSVFVKSKNSLCRSCRLAALDRCYFSQGLEDKYSQGQKEKIIQFMNDSTPEDLIGYNITKGRLRNFSLWKTNNGQVKALSDIELIEGFSERTAKKLFDSILEGPSKNEDKAANKIKGQFLHPYLSETVRKNCKSVLTVYVAVNSVSWTLVDKRSYEVVEWMYYGIDYPDSKRFQITDILDTAWSITQQLPTADIYVMKAEPTSLRSAGSDPSNPKVIAVNLQKAQMVAMIVALINVRSNDSAFSRLEDEIKDSFSQKIYFLRPTLPYRLYGTLIGTERVSTDQTVDMLLSNSNERSPDNSHVYVPEELRSMFRSQNELEKDMLGQCLLLALTFMDICIYKNQSSIAKLTMRK